MSPHRAGRAGSTRRFLVGFALTALLVAGVASYYASSHPDGLSTVATQVGFSGQGEQSPASDSPLAGYATKGIENDRVSRGVAGVAGSVLVLMLAGGLFWSVRRRGTTEPEA